MKFTVSNNSLINCNLSRRFSFRLRTNEAGTPQKFKNSEPRPEIHWFSILHCSFHLLHYPYVPIFYQKQHQIQFSNKVFGLTRLRIKLMTLRCAFVWLGLTHTIYGSITLQLQPITALRHYRYNITATILCVQVNLNCSEF